MTSKTLYIVVCGAPLASRAGDGVRAAREHGWDPYVIPTDAAMPWLSDQDLVVLGHEVGGGGLGLT